MELAVLLRELLLCSFPNGEKFNYQLICCVVSSDMKFPIVSTSIKRSASAQLFRHWEQSTQVDTIKLSSDVTPCAPPTQNLQISFRSSLCSVVETDMHFIILYIFAELLRLNLRKFAKWIALTELRTKYPSCICVLSSTQCEYHPLGILKQYVMIGCLIE